MLDYLKHHAKVHLRTDRYAPQLGKVTEGGPASSPRTFIMVCGTSFKAHVPNAASAIRFGYCRAFARLGFRYRLASVLDLADVLESAPSPFVFLSVYDFEVMDSRACRLLGDTPHFIWANPSRRFITTLYARHGRRPGHVRTVADYANRRAMDSGAHFAWATCTEKGLACYEDWAGSGTPLVSLPLACDDERYFPEDGNDKFKGVEMAFVGGYWANKAIQFDKFLRPYEDRLTVFGNSPWPYKGYRGRLGEDDERVLYQNARLSPAISEPHVEVTGDIVERVFKVAGSGGVAVTDVAPQYYRDIFSPDEILIPETIGHYHELVARALADDDFNAKYRAAGIKAVRARHTYVHRARTVLKHLGIAPALMEPA